MHTITLVCIRHEEIGKCNSHELYKIIEHFQPNVIFEEMPPSYFKRYYLEKSKSNLESETLLAYTEKYNTTQVQVDSEDVPADSFMERYQILLKRVHDFSGYNGFQYRSSLESYMTYIASHGFDFLNCISCDIFNSKLKILTLNCLNEINDSGLFETLHRWEEINDYRENVMFENIYKYSKVHEYEKAIFMIGAGHRRSIAQKIRALPEMEQLKITWSYFNEPPLDYRI